MVKKEKRRNPPVKWPIVNDQYQLFTDFLTHDRSQVSNTIEIWEAIPKYFLTPAQVKKLRTKDGLAKSFTWNYEYNQIAYAVRIQPALIGAGSEEKAYFPGPTEELVEEVLKKILLDEQYGHHDPDKAETWVKFSLSSVYRELKKSGRQRNRTEIRHALDVMSSCIITLYREDEEIWKGPILSNFLSVNRKEYLARSDSYHAAMLPALITTAINQIGYRQFNYRRLMNCRNQLTRWIYKKLINRYRQASLVNSYHFTYRSVVRDSGLLQQGRLIDNKRKLLAALNELVEQNVVDEYEVETRKQGRKIVDLKYTILPTREFVNEQTAANRRKSDSQEKMSQRAQPRLI